MGSSRLSRLGRGAGAAAFATYTALLFHVVSGGDVPGMLGVLVPLVLSTAVCTFLVGRRLYLLRLIASVLVAQFLFHLLFVFGAPGEGHSGMHHGAAVDVAASMPMGHDHGSMMWWGHALAAAITVAGLLFADRLLAAVAALSTRFIGWVRRILAPAVVLVSLAPRPFAIAWAAGLWVPVASGDLSGASRRGPPPVSV